MPQLGSLTVPKQGLGSMVFSHGYGHADEAESLRTIDRAIEIGLNFFDTADVYGSGHNETLLGKAFAGRRDKVIIASKFGNRLDRETSGRRRDGSPAYARKALEDSLKRLNVDVIDLYYLHRVDPATPIEETVGALARLKEEGKIREIGLSETDPATLRRAHKVHTIAALQSEYSLWARDVEAEVLPAARELGIGFVPFSPLGRGFLAGATASGDPKDRRNHHPRFQPEAIAANSVRRAVVEGIAARLGATVGQVSLAWLLAKGTVPIPGTRRIAHLESNWAANDLVLDAVTLTELDEAFPHGSTVGARSPQQAAQASAAA